jgi:hypothetical protein
VTQVLPFHNEPIRAIVANPGPVEVKREVLLSVMKERPGSMDMSRYAQTLFDDSSFPRLRELVRKSAGTDLLNWAAAGVLAHYGDVEILPELRDWHARLLTDSPKTAREAERLIWRIEVQSPPSRLLEYIASTGGWASRDWAVERASELGVPPKEIRAAILTFEEKARKDGNLIGQEATAVKKAGQRLGILRASDLPDVKLPPRRNP